MPTCFCNKTFATAKALEDHKSTKKHISKDYVLCGKCKIAWPSHETLLKHKRDTGHCYCPPCDRYFSDTHQLHLHDRLHCGVCKMLFQSTAKRNCHQRKTGHLSCGECGRCMRTYHALQTHLSVKGHASEFTCCDCGETFASTKALRKHSHKKVKEKVETTKDKVKIKIKTGRDKSPSPPLKPHCTECKRKFKTQSALDMHLASLKHKPITTLRCAATAINDSSGRQCGCVFTSPSAMLQHLENGKCLSGMTRGDVNRLVLRADALGVISDSSSAVGIRVSSQELISQSDESMFGAYTPSTGSQSIIFTPRTSGPATPLAHQSQKIHPSATDVIMAHVARGPLSCPLCPVTRRPFKTETALRNHLDSPVHAPRIFHAGAFYSDAEKSSLKGRLAALKRFSTVSGLTAHIESGAGKGGKQRMKMAVQYIEERLLAAGIGVKLLKNT